MFYDISEEFVISKYRDDDIEFKGVRDVLREMRARPKITDEGVIEFRGAYFQTVKAHRHFMFVNPLAMISKGRIEFTDIDSRHISVRYQLSLSPVRTFCIAVSLLFLYLYVFQGFPLPALLAGIPMVWLLFYGGDYLLTRSAFRRLLKRTIRNTF